MKLHMKLTLKIWRQPDPVPTGRDAHLRGRRHLPGHVVPGDARRAQRAADRRGEEPIAFDHDCREGICGMCGLMINGDAHGPERAPPPASCTCGRSPTATTITIEPWRAAAFPVIKDLCVDRRAFDRIIQAGGYISVTTGAAPDAHAIAGAQGRRRRGVRRGHLHRLRRLRRRLPQRLGLAVHRRQDHPPRPAAAGPARARHPGGGHGRPSTTPRASAAAPTSASAPRPAPRRSR